MLRSESTAELTKALVKAQAAMTFAKRDSNNPYFNSRYADLAAVVDAVKKPFTDNGLAFVQTTDIDPEGGVIVETVLLHESGEWVSGRLRMKPAKPDPQGIGSAITYARRYGLQAIAGIPTDDDDGNAASGLETTKTATRTDGKANSKASEQPTKATEAQPTAGTPAAPKSANKEQLGQIAKMGTTLGLSKEQLRSTCVELYEHGPEMLTFDEAVEWMKMLGGSIQAQKAA